MRLTDVFRAFRIGPAQAHSLYSRGTLPDRPRGTVTRDYVIALAKWHESARGQLPDAALEILESMERAQ
jgi:hypothetical protein